MVSPVISIVTLSFNQKQYLGECIYSVRTQKSDAVEYIVVDPGSTDGSRDLIEQNSDSIDVTVLDRDEGPADGLNKGFARAQGEIFGYINADDRLAPGALEFVAGFFSRNPRIDVLCGAIGMIDGSGRPSVRSRTADLFDLTRYAAGVCTVGQQGTFFRRKAFERAGGFNKLNRISWDGELLVDMALSGARFATVNKILGDFRIYPESITGSQRHAELFMAEHRRLTEKIRASGHQIHAPVRRLAARLLYKANVLRHLGYVLVR
jgi:glycosyltransferase involved in cell wall biosynthesis